MTRIAYVDKTSLVDWDGKVVAVVFMCGCNFRCWYCHNRDLVVCNKGSISLRDLVSFLKKRKNWLDGVVVTGGEPLLKNDIISILRRIKRLGYEVKIDTNGSKPELLQRLIGSRLVDYVAMDIKWYFDRYEEVVGVKVDGNVLRKSVTVLKNSDIDFEFRTTVLEDMRKSDVVKVAEQVAPARKYVLQAQLNNGKPIPNVEKTISSAYRTLTDRKFFRVLKVRNVKREVV